MKAVIVLIILFTLAAIALQYRKKGDLRTLFIALGSFAVILSLAFMGNMTRPVVPLFLAHIVAVVIAWGGLMWYLLRGRYYGWVIFLPAATIGAFWMLELLTGSAHESVSLVN